MTDRDRLAAEIDRHWLFRTDDGVFRCSADDWTHAPDDTVAEGDRLAPFSAHIADRLIAIGWTLLDEERLARALNSLAIPDEWLLRDRTPFAAAIAKAYREDTDAD